MKTHSRKKSKLVIGVTGAFGTGKSSAAGLMARGGVMIDADKIARGLLEPGGRLYGRILSAFGGGIIGAGGTLDRAKLGRLVFSRKNELEKMNSIMLPAIVGIIKRKISEVKTGLVIVDAPLLFETGLDRSVDIVVVVKATFKNRIERIRKRMKLSVAQIKRRTVAQMPLSKKLRSADFIIDNNGTLANLRKQVESLRRNVWKS